MDDDLAAFVGARLDEDERVARAVRPDPQLSPQDPIEFILNGQELATASILAAEGHVTRHNPARVLADVAVNRELLREYEQLLRSHEAHQKASAELAADIEHEERWGHWQGVGSPDVRARALRREADYLPAMVHVLEKWAKAKAAVYATHPDYHEDWRL